MPADPRTIQTAIDNLETHRIDADLSAAEEEYVLQTIGQLEAAKHLVDASF